MVREQTEQEIVPFKYYHFKPVVHKIPGATSPSLLKFLQYHLMFLGVSTLEFALWHCSGPQKFWGLSSMFRKYIYPCFKILYSKIYEVILYILLEWQSSLEFALCHCSGPQKFWGLSSMFRKYIYPCFKILYSKIYDVILYILLSGKALWNSLYVTVLAPRNFEVYLQYFENIYTPVLKYYILKYMM
jgi:hypothetical protein